MKTITKISLIVFALILATLFANAQQQIPFQGYVSQGFGAAVWNADGTGPEPAATGHQVPFPGFGNLYYYGASRDYISGNPDHAAFHFLPGMTGFPEFEQALINHGYTPGQLKVKIKLITAGEDVEGLDWFVIDNYHYSNHYNTDMNIIELDGEPMLAVQISHSIFKIHATSTTWIIETAYGPVKDISQNSSSAVQAAATAFINDLNGKEIRMTYESTYGQSFSGNGRNGSYYNILNGVLEVGNPTFPFEGLNSDNEGFAGWDADGTGPEPFGNGHSTQAYYGASVDYDGINPDTNACLGHLLEGSAGFLNTLLQLQYRGFEIGDLKMKLGLNSLGPDVEGEDWGYENGQHWCNYYNDHFLFELNGEPILKIMADTLKLMSMTTYWKSGTSVGKVYDISENATPEAQFVAQSFLKDLGSHYLSIIADQINYVTLFSGNGRDGAIYQIAEGRLEGLHRNITFVPPGEVNGTWSAEGSPYYVDGHLEVADGETLLIEPGVKVAMRGPYHFNVQGCVKAEGTEDAKIIFTRSNPNLWWDGFDYYETPATNEASVFDHCVFEYGYGQGSNAGLNSGGAFAIKSFDKVKICNTAFRHNKVDKSGIYPPSGGAIGLWESSPLIQKCIFHDNSAEYGGAIFVYSHSEPVISNCLLYDNYGERGGAITFYYHGNGTIINNTISGNDADLGGALYFYYHSNPEVINTILWDNQANNGNQVCFSIGIGPCNPGFFYCNIEGGKEAFGNISFNGDFLFNLDLDPDFSTEPGAMPYMLNGSSPCIDIGTPDTSAWFYPEYLPDLCLCGNTRICNGRIDMGAYEFSMVGVDFVDDPGLPVTIFPNPFAESFYIRFSLTKQADVSVYLYNSHGAAVAETDYGLLQNGNHEKIWNTGILPKGAYLLVVKISGKHYAHKVLKSK